MSAPAACSDLVRKSKPVEARSYVLDEGAETWLGAGAGQEVYIATIQRARGRRCSRRTGRWHVVFGEVEHFS